MSKRTYNKVLFILLILIINITSIIGFTSYSVFEDTNQSIIGSKKPLKILNNNDLISYIINNSLPGDGSKGNPFVIENFNFNINNTNNQLEIRNTDLYIVIRNNTIMFGQEEGLLLSNVTNLKIQNNYFSNNIGDAILINSSTNIEVNNNFITNSLEAQTYFDVFGLLNYPFSIDIAYSKSVTISNNNLFNNWDGIWFWGGDTNCTAKDNKISNNHFEGLGAGGNYLHPTTNIVLSNNFVTNVRYGVWFAGIKGSTLVSNNIFANSTDGIRATGSLETVFSNNTLRNNTEYGIVLSIGSHNCTVEHNFVLYNRIGISIADSFHQIHFNNFINNSYNSLISENNMVNVSYNYWSDSNSTDYNHDGILDKPYKLQGSKELYDNFPLANEIFGDFNPVNQSKDTISTESQNNTSNESKTSNLSFDYAIFYALIVFISMIAFFRRRKY